MAICLSAGLAGAQSITNQINWGSLDASTIVDSKGNQLIGVVGITIDLGAFADDFTPTAANVDDWAANWFSFDRAQFAIDGEDTSLFASRYMMYQTGNFDKGAFDYGDFEDLGISRSAYIWVYNLTEPVPGAEWFLAGAGSWEFPTLAEECCDNDVPIEWSLSDLAVGSKITPDTPVIPVWGNYLGNEGSGEVTNRNVFADLQTYTFVVPEPSSALLIAMAGIIGAFRRSRQSSVI